MDYRLQASHTSSLALLLLDSSNFSFFEYHSYSSLVSLSLFSPWLFNFSPFPDPPSLCSFTYLLGCSTKVDICMFSFLIRFSFSHFSLSIGVKFIFLPLLWFCHSTHSLCFPLKMPPLSPFPCAYPFLPPRNPNPAVSNHLRSNFSFCIVAALIDVHSFPVFRLHERLRSIWLLKDPFNVDCTIGGHYLLCFRALEDLDYVVDNGPWAINNSLLVLERWHVGINLRNL